MEWNRIIRNRLYDVSFGCAIAFMVSAFFGWFTPPLFVCFVFAVITATVFAIYTRLDELERKVEMEYLAITGAHLSLMVVAAFEDIYTWEGVISKPTFMKLLILLLVVMVTYAITAYFRAKSNYRKVRGNQKHSNKWRVSKKEKQAMEEDAQVVFFTLGMEYEKE